MKTTNQTQQVIHLQVTEGLAVAVIQDTSHEFLMPTKDVAVGYGVSEETLWSHKRNHREELTEGVHFLTRIENIKSGQNGTTKRTYWTKAGIVRLGMFIRSERAKLFRDWVEQVVLQVTAPQVTLPTETKRKHNRLNAARIIDILADVALIDDKALRLSIIGKLLPDREIPAIQLQLPLEKKGGRYV